MSERIVPIKSYVVRNSRMTSAQKNAFESFWPAYGLRLENGCIHYQNIFTQNANAPCFLEIGFGNGQSLLALAKAFPQYHFIGVETYKPGIGALLLGMKQAALTNIRIYFADAVLVLSQAIPHASLDGIQIFFPDPWPKRRHHPRRLIQPQFVQQLISKLKINASLHLATDQDDYAYMMMQILTQNEQLINVAGEGKFSERSPYRPIFSKFETQAKKAGRPIWDLQFQLQSIDLQP